MKKSVINIFCIICFTFLGFSQEDGSRGSIGNKIKSEVEGKKRALIIGISDYQAESLELDYADDDAMLFKEYLEEVEEIPEEDLVFLRDNEAISVSILNELKKLMKASEKGDTIYLYFAGHGDVVDDFGGEEGFLLATDANENQEYYGTQGVVPLRILNRVIDTVTEKGAQVILVLDACRSGFLYKEGAQKNLETLNNNFQNSTKFLSCGPSQLSYESKELGHGYFTYYLVLGFMGAADVLVQDNTIQYFELAEFLNNNVKNQTNQKQIPVVWNQNTVAVFKEVNTKDKELALKQIQSSSKIRNIWKARNGEGFVTEFLTDNPIIQRFNDALAKEDYYGTSDSALELYKIAEAEQLAKENVLERMKFTIISALSTRAQILINTYIGGAEVLPKGEVFTNRAEDLEVCLSLLEKDDFSYDRFLTSKLFLEAYSTIRSRNYSNYPIAKQKLKEALEIEERAAYIHNSLGLILNHENEFEEALKHYNRAAQLIPSWSFPLNNIGGNYLDNHQYDKAEEYYENALKLKGSYATAINNLGVVYENQGKYHKAELQYLRAKEIDDESSDAFKNLGNLYRDRGNIQKAISYYEKALERDSTHVYTYYSYSDLLNDHNIDSKKAEELLIKAIDLEPYFSRGHAQYADFLRRFPKGESSLIKAESLYDFAIKNDPFYTWSYAGRGWLYHKQKKKEKALESFNEGIQKNSLKPRPYFYLAKYYKSGLDNSDKAIEYYLKTIEKDAYFLPAYEDLISLYNRKKEYDKSLALINNVLEWNSDAPDIYNYLGKTYFVMKDYEKAIEAFENSIKTDSTYAKGYTNLAYSLMKTKQYEKATQAYKSASLFNPYKNKKENYAKLMITEAKKLNRLGNSKDAAVLLEQAKVLDNNFDTQFSYAQYYYLLGNIDKASEGIKSINIKDLSKTRKVKALELACKIAVDSKEKERALQYLTELQKIDPKTNNVLEALVKLVNKEKKAAKELIAATNKLLLSDKFLRKKYSPKAIKQIKSLQ